MRLDWTRLDRLPYLLALDTGHGHASTFDIHTMPAHARRKQPREESSGIYKASHSASLPTPNVEQSPSRFGRRAIKTVLHEASPQFHGSTRPEQAKTGTRSLTMTGRGIAAACTSGRGNCSKRFRKINQLAERARCPVVRARTHGGACFD